MQEQWFDGIRFTIGPGRRYFDNSNISPKSMHQYVWSYYNGPVPKGYEVHHIDGDRYNNDISNLQLLEKHEHRRLHGRMLTDEQREWRRNNINIKARPKAIEWHKSNEGHEWHKKQVETRKDNRREVRGICKQCGKEFVGYNNQGHARKFCSQACAQKFRRASGVDLVDDTCIICGNTFMKAKSSKKQTCSRSCANKLAWKRGKTGKAGSKLGDNWRLDRKGH